MVILCTPTNRFTLAHKVNRDIIVFILIVFLNTTALRGSRISDFGQTAFISRYRFCGRKTISIFSR